jgi:hypothetical protein
MATLVTISPDGTETRTPVFKSLTTIGADPESDIVLKGADVPPLAAHIAYDGNTFTIASQRSEILVSGRQVKKQTLVDGDDIVIASVRMRFHLDEKPKVAAVPDGREMEAYRRVVEL